MLLSMLQNLGMARCVATPSSTSTIPPKSKRTPKVEEAPRSPKITQEKKSTDFDTTNVRSPIGNRKTVAGKGSDLHRSIYAEATSYTAANRYKIENPDFAKGAYGKILLAHDRITKKRVIIKKIALVTPIKMIRNEVRAGQLLGHHENIADFHQYLDMSTHHELIFEHVEGQDLFTWIEKLGFVPRSDSDARSYFTQILGALKHVHSKAIAHRDIKLENILIDDKGKINLIDFGLCAFIEKDKLCNEWCGSDNYLAPEIVRRTPYDGYKADVFSLGVVLFALVYGVFPFDNLRVNGYHSNDPSRPLRKLVLRFPPAPTNVNPAVKDLLCKMLEDDPVKRISVEEIFQHEWVTATSPAIEKVSCESSH